MNESKLFKFLIATALFMLVGTEVYEIINPSVRLTIPIDGTVNPKEVRELQREIQEALKNPNS